MSKIYLVFLCSFSSLTQSMGFLRRACAGQMSRGLVGIVPRGARAISPQTPQSLSLPAKVSASKVKEKMIQHFFEKGYDERNAINQEIKALLANDPEIGYWKDSFTANTLLHFAAAYANPDVVDLLAKQHPSLLEITNYRGKTALDIAEAVFEGSQDMTARAEEVSNSIRYHMHTSRTASGDK